jgi:hypothetical protein
MLKPLTPEERKKAREAFHEVMNTNDDDPLEGRLVLALLASHHSFPESGGGTEGTLPALPEGNPSRSDLSR